MKSAKQPVVPLSTAALAVLDRQRSVHSGDAVFPGRSGGLPLVDRFEERDLYTGLRSMPVSDRCTRSRLSVTLIAAELGSIC